MTNGPVAATCTEALFNASAARVSTAPLTWNAIASFDAWSVVRLASS